MAPATLTRAEAEGGPGGDRAGRLGQRLRLGARLSGLALRLTVIASFGIVWQIVTTLWETVYFPPPTEILADVYETWLTGPASHLFLSDAVFEDIVPSLVRLLSGWLIAVFAGVLLGYAIGRVRAVGDFLDPIVQFARAIPPPALIPLSIVLLGIGDAMKVALIAFGVVWPILLNTIDGVRSVEPQQLETARVFHLSRIRQITRIILPAASPKIFAGLRISLSIAVILMVVSEMVAATEGIGFFVLQAQRSFRILDMWAGILLLGVLGYGLNAALLGVEARVLRWHRGAYGEEAGV
jgi:ABC-type nitrate/sulfonate/bicarbonate transport system permease component